MYDIAQAEQIYDELLRSYHIPGAHERWADHRNRVTELIIRHTTPGHSLAIIGAGGSDDIDLARLYEQVGSLTLYDIDREALERSLGKYALVGKHNVELCVCDLFGATKSDYLDLIGIWLEAISIYRASGKLPPAARIAEDYLAGMQKIYERVNARQGNLICSDRVFDHTVMIGVHSQITGLVTRIWEFFVQVVAELGDFSCEEVLSAAKSENDILMPRLNGSILEMTRERSFIGAEVCALERPGGIEGAWQALRDIRRRIDAGEIGSGSYMEDEWPLLDDLTYQMRIYRLELK